MLYHKIATGYVKSEERKLDAADAAYVQTIHKKIVEPAASRLHAGQKLSLADSRQMIGSVMQAIAGNPCVLSARHQKAMKSLSSSADLDSLHTTTMTWKRSGSALQLVLERERFEMQPRALSIIQSEAALEFTRHAYQRLVQRSEGRKEVVRYMMATAEDHIGLLYLMLRPGSAMPQRSIAFPMGDGLLLGTVVNEIRGMGAGYAVGYGVDRRGYMDLDLSRPVVLKEPASEHRYMGFQARTYIGPAEMKPQQKELHTKLLAIYSDNIEAFNQVADYCYFTHDPSHYSGPSGLTLRTRCSQIHEQIVDLFMSGRYARAMGNESSPGHRPLPALEERATELKQREIARNLQALLRTDLPTSIGY